MPFISIEFTVFFIIVVLLYFWIPQRFRIPYLLVVSYIFYGYYFLSYALILLFATLSDYVIALKMSREELPSRRNQLLFLSLGINFGLLAYYKYLSFLGDTLSSVLDVVGVTVDAKTSSVLLPLGISFYTFAKVAYVIDVYRKRIEPEQNLVTFATFVAFFPNLSSGPIERAEHLIPQFRKSIRFDDSRIVEGLRLILWGAFKKIVIADRLAIYIDNVYGYPQKHQGLVLIAATIFLSFQIYADFSGYTDMARGVARILGINLFENFRQPYFSKSILEFWRRWHMSLTTWIREYLFFPLSRYLLKRTQLRSPRAVQINSYLVVMSLVGLWHGASWTFMIWGLLHGIYMGIESLPRVRTIRLKAKDMRADMLNIITTFTLVTFAWIFFRANSLDDAGYILTHLFSFHGEFLNSFSAYTTDTSKHIIQLFILLGLIAIVILADWLEIKQNVSDRFIKLPIAVRWAGYYLLIALIFASVISEKVIQDFVYFQF